MSVCFVSIGLRRYECRRIFLFYREEDKVEWLYLGIAGAMEVLWSTFLKFSEGFTKPMPTVITLAGLAASMFFLAKAAKVLPIGTAYGIWTGIGALGAVMTGTGSAVFGVFEPDRDVSAVRDKLCAEYGFCESAACVGAL